MNKKSTLKLKDGTIVKLRCPVCKRKLEIIEDTVKCISPNCQSIFPIVDGTPILINESASIFSIEECAKIRTPTAGRRTLLKYLPSLSRNLNTKENYEYLAKIIAEEAVKPKILIIGGGELGAGMEPLYSIPGAEFIETDIYLNSTRNLVCDAHDIPFEDNTFDCIIAQAVLEHVVDPHRCVAEFHRTLKPNGIVYAETPFMQPVHMGAYDFTRFTDLGHRRLFRNFTEMGRGITGGAGEVLGRSWFYFLRSFTNEKSGGRMRMILSVIAIFTAFWLKFLDPLAKNTVNTCDAASGYFFMGRKSDQILSDKELIKLYKGSFF